MRSPGQSWPVSRKASSTHETHLSPQASSRKDNADFGSPSIGGPVGALIAFIFAGLVIFSVMRSLAEMVSVRPVKGAIMDYPDVFVDEALGFAVGITYWLIGQSQSLIVVIILN